MSISHEIFLEAMEKFKESRHFHGTEMSRDLKIPMTSLSYNISGKRKWTADRWIHTMIYLGMIKAEGNRLVFDYEGAENLVKEILSKPKKLDKL